MLNHAPCCSAPALILPKAGLCPPIPPCPVCGFDPCRCKQPCPPPCPPPEPPCCPPPRPEPRCTVCGFDPCRCKQPCPPPCPPPEPPCCPPPRPEPRCPVCGFYPCRCKQPCPPPCPPPEPPCCPPPRPEPRCPVCGFYPCRCKQPCVPAQSGRFLISRILGTGSCRERQVCERLCLERIPRAAVPPYTLQSVTVSSEPPLWDELPCDRRGTMQLLVATALICVIRDARGECYQAPATLSRRVCLRLSCALGDCWRRQIVIQACVRLLNCPQGCQDGCFEALLETQIEAYATALCVAGRPDTPECPFDDRPLFPPPCRPWR